ncbi:MAG: NAD nucleotidase [Acidimicrobiales bacterium]|nr:NAD nucleotidase [Acidimicrobiales bacterium]
MTSKRRFAAVISAAALIGVVLATASPVSAQTDECGGMPATIVAEADTPTMGTDGNDVILGTDGNDFIDGGAGNDIICGGDGNDILIGGLGNDSIYGEDGRDVLRGNLGRDLLVGGKNIDRLSGGSGADRLVANKGNDRMFGGSGADVLLGGGGPVDRVNGGGGTDVCNDPQDTTRFTNCEAGDGATDFELKIIHINDHHSHLNPDSGDLDLGGASTRVSLGGFPSVVTKMKELEVTADNVVKVHAGDAITGTLFYSLFKGEADAAMMNEICFDIFELGNHEFDDGDEGLVNFLDFLEAGGCDTAVLGANVVPAVGTPLAPTSPDDRVKAYRVMEFGGEKVGFVGLDIANKTKNSSSPLKTTQFLDEMTTAQAYINVLTRMGINKIVLVTHIQFANDMELAAGLTGVDVIVGGDSHTALGNGLAALGVSTAGDYPVKTTDANGAPVCIVQAWQYSWVVGELDVEFTADGEVNKCDGTPHLLLGDEFLRRPADGGDRVPVTGDDLAAIEAQIAATPELSVVTPDPAAQAVLDGYSEQVTVLEQEVIGTATDDLCLERIPGQGRSQICDVADTAMMGGDIQQLVTEAFHVRAFESDFALQNAGGVRIDIPAGDFTIADAYELLPFANTIVNMEMTGAEVQAVLEEAVSNAIDPDGSTGAYPYAAGLRFDVDLNAAAGSRVTNHEVDVDGTWTPIDLAATYTVATNSFIASGQDGYITFGTVSEDGRAFDTLLDYAQSFIDYVEKDVDGTLSKLDPSDYSTQNFTPLAG